MSLKCRDCGSRNTDVVSAKELSENTGDESIMISKVGAIDPMIVAAAIRAIFLALEKLSGYLKEKEKGNRKVVVCKDCGYWEKV